MCISILHDPGEDKFGYERPEERWLPIHTVTTIMMSVISMLADPNDESPANIDAAVCSMLLITVTSFPDIHRTHSQITMTNNFDRKLFPKIGIRP